ncbi:MAG: hypothetical protein KDB80_12805 [Planctomycetes bacterium]|nr:hypothetical protein [Planctomycetota bacterium]
MAGTLKKAVVAQFLTAVKTSLSHLSELKIVLADEGSVPSGVSERDALQWYSRVRRLREALRRWMSTYPEPEDLGLDTDDRDLLASCLVFELNLSDRRAEHQNLNAADRKLWLAKHNEVLTTWIVELASKPIQQLPIRWKHANVAYEVRQVLVAVRDKVKEVRPFDDPSGVYRHGVSTFGQGASGDSPRIEDGTPIGLQSNPDIEPARVEISSVAESIVDSTQIQDYRLRLTLAMDVRAYHRCVLAEDHRLALVMLGMVLEGCVLDYALSRKGELGLEGAPSSWQLHRIVESLLESKFEDSDRTALQIINASLRALRPVSHLEHPFVVNKAMVEQVEKFVRKTAAAMGLRASEPEVGRALPGAGSGPNTAVDVPL